jgi:ribonuclease HII
MILGIDDAGRGPIIGPMVLAGVLLTNEQEKILKENDVRDSKMLTQASRVIMEKLIKENSVSHKIIKASPELIDGSLSSGTNLNELEAKMAAKIINYLNKDLTEQIKVIIDCPSVNVGSWKVSLTKYLERTDNLEISCEHKADANHVSAAAGSILAKVTREEEVSKLKKEFGDFGSGYPSDPKTKEFLVEKGKEFEDSGLFRKTWATWKKAYPENSQGTLDNF